MLNAESIREAVVGRRWAISRHARERAGKRRIGDAVLVNSLLRGEVLERYPEDPRGPSALILGYTEEGRPIHTICAFDPSGTLLMITAYEPLPPRWTDERTRGLGTQER